MKITPYDDLHSDELVTLLAERDAVIAEKNQAIFSHQKNLQAKDNTIALLQEQLNVLTQKRFGRSTEKDDDPRQMALVFDEAEASIDIEEENEVTTEVKPHTRKKRGRVALPGTLPRVDVIHDLTDEEKICPIDGHELHEIGEVVSEQLELIPAKVQVIRHRRKKYGCRCCEQTVVTAKAPKQPIPKSIASPSLLGQVAVSKYHDALPLYRQESILQRYGIDLPRATLANWMIKAGELVTPLINRLRDHLLEAPLIHMDETTVQVLKPDKPDKTSTSKNYMWVQVSSGTDTPVRLFDYAASRSQQVPQQLLMDYHGLLVTDGYEGYNAVANQSSIAQLACWAHVRRKFHEALKAQKNKTGKAQMAMSLIQKLYAIEKIIKDKTPEEKLAYRQQHAKRVLDKIKAWADKSVAHVLPKSLLGKAIAYLLKLWPKLTRYADNLHGVIDNNPAENAIRPFVVGRKNWLFSQSVNGAKASANLYSIIETAKANGLEPFHYLNVIFKTLPNIQNIDELDALLPWATHKP